MTPNNRIHIPELASFILMSLPFVFSQTCSTLAPRYAPQMAPGYQARVILNGLRSPRGIAFDGYGNLLLVESGSGIRYIQLSEVNGNVCVGASKTLVSDSTLNHGIALTRDSRTLFASSVGSVFAWPYDGCSGTAGANSTLVTGMSNGGHSTRTLLIPRTNPDVLLVSRGSDGNLDLGTADVNSGRSQIRIFNISQLRSTPADYSTSGELLGWGLRNSVGVGEDASTGGIWSVENSADNIERLGKDVHQTNPGEELNYHGRINSGGRQPQWGANYGYPSCFSAWDPSVLPNNANIAVGTQFLIGSPSGTLSDSFCASQRQAPRITFASHTAPLDIKFKSDGSAAYVSFHGSWNRQPPDGYRVSRIDFVNGQPREPPTSTTAAVNIMVNQNNNNCPGSCFRPVGLAIDKKGRLFVTSDSTGELFVITGT